MTVLLQQNGAFLGSATSMILTFPQPVQPGSLLVAYGGSSTTGRTMSASDDVNGAYNIDKAAASSCAIMSFPNTGGGTPNVTITVSGAATIMMGIIEEWSLIKTTNPLDQTASTTGIGVPTGTGGTTPTLNFSNELVLSMLCCNSNAGANFAAQSPFTPSPASPQNNISPNIFLAAGNSIAQNTAAQTCTFNWTNNVSFRSCTATYQTIATGGPDTLLGQGWV